MTQVTGWVDLCRLCGKKNGVRISIFDSAPECLAKIEAVVPDIVVSSPYFPRFHHSIL